MILNVTVENRAPKIEVRSQRTEAKVEYPITLYAYANDSDSEKVWPGVVDIYWPGANCEEGYYTRTCTTTSNVEGLKTFTAVGTDDDSATTSATFEVKFTNIQPHSINIQMVEREGPIIMDAQDTWHVDRRSIRERPRSSAGLRGRHRRADAHVVARRRPTFARSVCLTDEYRSTTWSGLNPVSTKCGLK